MIDIQDELEKHNMKSKMLIQVHEELIFDMYKTEKDFLVILVKERMENAFKLKVPLTRRLRYWRYLKLEAH